MRKCNEERGPIPIKTKQGRYAYTPPPFINNSPSLLPPLEGSWKGWWGWEWREELGERGRTTRLWVRQERLENELFYLPLATSPSQTTRRTKALKGTCIHGVSFVFHFSIYSCCFPQQHPTYHHRHAVVGSTTTTTTTTTEEPTSGNYTVKMGPIHDAAHEGDMLRVVR